jgi:hypothetical protein
MSLNALIILLAGYYARAKCEGAAAKRVLIQDNAYGLTLGWCQYQLDRDWIGVLFDAYLVRTQQLIEQCICMLQIDLKRVRHTQHGRGKQTGKMKIVYSWGVWDSFGWRGSCSLGFGKLTVGICELCKTIDAGPLLLFLIDRGPL